MDFIFGRGLLNYNDLVNKPTLTTGPQGEKGDTGPQGIQGESGQDGSQGPAGVDGAQGPTGADGSQGETGPQGPAGDAATAAGVSNHIQYNVNGLFTGSANLAFDGTNTLTLGDALGANIGLNNTYTAGYNFGNGNTSTDPSSTTIGVNNVGGIADTFVGGSNNNATGAQACAVVGTDNIVTGTVVAAACAAIGIQCEVTGFFAIGSLAMGFGCTTDGSTGAVSIGLSCRSAAGGAVSMGNSIVNTTSNSFKFGYLDDNSITMSVTGITTSYGQQLNIDGSVFLPNVDATPTTPVDGGTLYVEDGALKYKGSSGTVTNLGAA